MAAKRKATPKRKKRSPTVGEIAKRIDAHLKRFEADKRINAPTSTGGREKLQPYFDAWASSSGAYVRICYVSYQRSTCVSKVDATVYLGRLDSGYVGRHFEALRNIGLEERIAYTSKAIHG